jgi:hypothetical protein
MKEVYDTFSKFHDNVDIRKIAGRYHPILPIEEKTDDNRLTNQHVRKKNFASLNLFSGEMETRNNPLPTEFKGLLELSTRAPLCPCPLVLDTMGGFCGYNCIAVGTLVNTLNGKIPIEQIKIGDIVKGYTKGKLIQNTVTMKKIYEKRKVLKIITKSGEIIKCTPDHKIYTKRGWIEAKDLNCDDLVLNYKCGFTGDKNPFYGKHHNDETKEKIRNNQTIEQKENLSKRMKENNPMFNDESRKKMVITQKNNNKDGGNFAKLWKEGRIPIHSMNEKTKNKLSILMKNKNPMNNKEIAKKMGNTLKNKWATDETFRNKMLSRVFVNISPTVYEIELKNILNEMKMPYRFVGDKNFYVGPCVSGKCRNPDFIHHNFISKRKVIEICGWKNSYDLKIRDDDYKSQSIDALWIYKDELKNINILKSKIIQFNGEC